MKWIFALCLLAPSLASADCPASPDHSARLGEVITALGNTRSEGDARGLTEELWSLWTDAPDQKAQRLLDEGMSRRSSYDFLGARDVLDELVEYCPNYAEGYNQRAFASYLRQDFSAALYDLERALELMPNHVAALSGKGLTLMGLGRHGEAQDALRAAVELNPWLSERSLLVDTLGTDI